MWTKNPRVEPSAVAPAAPLPTQERASVDADKSPAAAKPPQQRHRMAGTHEGMYVTEHHRRPRRRG